MENFISNQITRQLNSFYNLKTTSRTLPQISTRIFKLISLNPLTPLTRGQKNLEKVIQLGYPTSFTKTTGKRLFLYDINSLYPFCFINKYPSKIDTPDSSKHLMIIKATISPPNFSRAYYSLPSNDNTDTFYSSQEITYLSKLGYTFKTADQLKLPYRTDIFLDFVIHLFSRKTDHPKLVKHLLNSFYGKLISSESSTITPLMLQHMISYSRIYTHKIKLNQTNLSIYTDTDSFTVQHPFRLTTSQKLGSYKNLISRPGLNIADDIKITSPRNYIYSMRNRKETKSIGAENNISHIDRSFYREITINNKKVNSISTIEFIYN